jgi:hypothetical protein
MPTDPVTELQYESAADPVAVSRHRWLVGLLGCEAGSVSWILAVVTG